MYFGYHFWENGLRTLDSVNPIQNPRTEDQTREKEKGKVEKKIEFRNPLPGL